MKLILQFAKSWPGRFLCQGGRGARMTPGIKRLYHWAWPSLLALYVPIHDGESNTTRMSAFVRADTEGRRALPTWERKTRWDRKSVVPEETLRELVVGIIGVGSFFGEKRTDTNNPLAHRVQAPQTPNRLGPVE